jgi:hypothetical protein
MPSRGTLGVPRPDPFDELRLVSLRSLRGANFWSSRPVTRVDLTVGAFDDISSAEVPGVTESLLAAFPGLVEHRCSIGERGGFIVRLRRGTYAPHILEHVALELQSMIGQEVGYGRARGGDRPGEYTVVFEHLHAGVGLRAGALALEIVQRAFAGALDSIEHAILELTSLSESPDVPALKQAVLCGVTGGGDRSAVRDEMVRRGYGDGELIVDLAPSYVLNAGLPYSRSTIAVILDAQPTDVPDRYRETDRAEQLVSVVADAVPRDGIVVVPATEWEVQGLVRDARCRVAVFTTGGKLTRRDTRLAHAVGLVRGGRITIECLGEPRDAGELRPDTPADAQVAAAVACFALAEEQPAEHRRVETWNRSSS